MTDVDIAAMTVPDKIWVVTDPRRNSTTGWWWSFDPDGEAVEYIRALATPEQTAALDAVKARAWADGMREAAEIAKNDANSARISSAVAYRMEDEVAKRVAFFVIATGVRIETAILRAIPKGGAE